MAEKETKEKATITMNIWFILFLIYLIISLAYGYSLINENKALKVEIANKEQTITDIENLNQYTTDELSAIINDISGKLAEAKNLLEERKNQENLNNAVEISTGVYTGSSAVSGDEVATSMTLTLSEDNIASLALTNESGDSIVNGTYSIAENTVVFTSDDGLTTYSFTANEDGTLKLVDSELTLSK